MRMAIVPNGASAGHAAGGYRGAGAGRSLAVEDVETRYETRHHASCVSVIFSSYEDLRHCRRAKRFLC